MKCEQYTIYIQVLCTTHEQHTGARAHPLNAHIYIHTYVHTLHANIHTYICMYVHTLHCIIYPQWLYVYNEATDCQNYIASILDV